jgi:iron-sulfur cluster repair protein YtfE (RIC family)
MDVTSALAGEHGVFHLLVEQLDDATGSCGTIAELRAAAAPLAIALIGHARVEEATLFAPLERSIGEQGPLHCLRREHEDMDRQLRGLFRIDDADAMRAAIRTVLDLTRRHLAREEQVLFAVADRALTPAARETLGGEWARSRGVTLPGSAPAVAD